VIVYADTSALVKTCLAEYGSADVIALTSKAEAVGTSVVSSAEAAAAFARAVRLGLIDLTGGQRAQRKFTREWPNLTRVPATEALISRAGALAWNHDLRGYDAIQLASALAWQDALGQEVILATFDRQLWEAASDAGLHAWPATFKP
jgi:predicted nucleic acid-binding protein